DALHAGTMARNRCSMAFQPLVGETSEALTACMAAPAGIDWDWALRTGGVLSARQKRQLLVPLARSVLRYHGVRLRLAVGPRGPGSIDLDAIRWPDSALAIAATGEARAVLSSHILAHSFRTYLFGLMLARVERVSVDEELVYVACVLHDTELEHPVAGRCFAV